MGGAMLARIDNMSWRQHIDRSASVALHTRYNKLRYMTWTENGKKNTVCGHTKHMKVMRQGSDMSLRRRQGQSIRKDLEKTHKLREDYEG